MLMSTFVVFGKVRTFEGLDILPTCEGVIKLSYLCDNFLSTHC